MNIREEIEAEKARLPIEAPGYAKAQNAELSDLMMGDLSHEEVANRVRGLMRDDWNFEPTLCAARDRIAWLAARVEELETELAAICG